MIKHINPIFELISENEPFVKSLSSIYGIVKNYQRDKKIELNSKELAYIKNILRLSTYELTEIQMKIIDVFLIKSEQSNENLNRISLTYDDINEKYLINELDFQKNILELESENFINTEKFIDNSKEYQLNYNIFIESNLIYNLFNKSICYYEILNIVVDLLFQIEDEENIIEINVNKFMQQNSLNYLFMNPIIYHLANLDIIEYDTSLTQNILINENFYIKDKSNLLKLKKQLLLKT